MAPRIMKTWVLRCQIDPQPSLLRQMTFFDAVRVEAVWASESVWR